MPTEQSAPSATTRAPRPVRRLPVGTEVQPDGGVHVRVWAPERRRVRVRVGAGEGAREHALVRERGDGGYWSAFVESAGAGSRYAFLLDDDERAYPDPASRAQPDGPHGTSLVVDPAAFAWTDAAWRGVRAEGQVLYELHVGTFTREGTWAAAARELPELARLGITIVEVLPVAEFPGRFGWGYDGVNLFAPTRLYGTPDDLRAFIDAAHRAGVGVILDVVYNHLGPDGNYLGAFSPHYFDGRRTTEWGDPPNFDGAHNAPVRELFVANAGYWIDEFHFDGLRLDATQSIHDDSPRHVLAQIGERARAAARGRGIYVVNENEPQEARLVRPESAGGRGLDAVWNDDWHHSAVVALTGRDEAYFTPYRGHAQEFVSAAKHGFLYQGQLYYWQRHRRGTPSLDLEPWRFVHFLQNHDQVANTTFGLRCHNVAGRSRWRALTALLLLGPQTPMLFQGQEFAASTPFHYFADHEPALAAQVEAGRREFLAQFPSAATADVRDLIPAPHDPATFAACVLDLTERGRHAWAYALHEDLLRLRREDARFAAPRKGLVDGAVLGMHAFVLRFFDPVGDDDRLLVVNLGTQLRLANAPEPLLAPPEGRRWELLWSSEHPRYGGLGTAPVDTDEAGWQLPPDAAVVLAPREPSEDERRRGADRRKRIDRRNVPSPFA